MSKTWEQFVQSSNSMVIVDSDTPPVGLSSDAEELRRAGLDPDIMGHLAGVGNELYGNESTIGTE